MTNEIGCPDWIVRGPDGLEEVVSALTKQEAIDFIAENFDVPPRLLKAEKIK